ncbi:nitrogen regulatory IIA protein [Pedobacter sp. ISL-68]|uniref:nitrogen regulatory IIA protein n=1 Tax=unclassified Pedobacter TaxID=2628915 RepID=UPI001BEC3592|nr:MULTISPECIES: nitrogen regulatory IIA protein [unclassified Pedobacter]MBT2559819.1 nitrogen regulatory IIA protein [Pedobacter sp. ISL-64]MBT2592124.1 nitrogen regulatory IIA protein [Pedobacter sp. ISL-68]
MKKLRAMFHVWESRIEQRWSKLSERKQRRFIVLFFAGYLLITACVIATVWFDAKTERRTRKNGIEHIQNPILKRENQLGDSSSIILKNKQHERE